MTLNIIASLKPKIILLIIFASILNLCYGQTGGVVLKKDTILISLSKVTGLGPGGNSSYGLGSYDALKNTEAFKAYPQVKNAPPNLTHTVQYLYILDEFQFFYQNYVAGVFTKSFMLEKANMNHWVLADTAHMSKKTLLCAFAVLAGKDPDNKDVVIVDANNNNDFADDEIRPLLKNVYNEDQILQAAVSVKTNYYRDGSIYPDSKLVFVQRNRNPQTFELSFTFPEFNYTRFTYKNLSYIMCADYELGHSYICVLADRPYFTQVSRGAIVTANHYVNIGGVNFKFVSYDRYSGVVSLVGPTSDFFQQTALKSAAATTVASNQDLNTVSNQVGFKAPFIRGKNMNPLLKLNNLVSTKNLIGKYVFINFWSTYCAPCMEELPTINAAYQKYSRKKFEIVGVFDERSPKLTKKIFTTNRIKWPNIRMNSKDSEISGYGHIEAFPTNFLIDPTGKIIGFDLRKEDLINRLKALIEN